MTTRPAAAGAPSESPAPTAAPTPTETTDHGRNRRELERLLARAHRNLDQRGVPRTPRST